MRTTTRTLMAVLATVSLAAASVAAPATASKGKGKGGSAPTTGTGLVFQVNPVQSSGNQDLTDQKDSRNAVPQSAYRTVPLRNLDGTGYLTGSWVTVESSTGKPAHSTTGVFAFDRSQDQFEQVMAYFWVNQAQEYLQDLGFGSSLPGIVDERFPVKVGQYGGDNSYLTESPYRVRLGKGGVDDGEDGEVIVHEYGHAVQADQVPGFGSSDDAGAAGEGFGDYFAVSVGLDAVSDYGWTMRGNTPGETAQGWEAAACVADWDATEYSQSTTAKCLRRIDQAFTVSSGLEGVHARGMIWSGALWRIRQDYVAAGKGSQAWDRTMINAQFGFAEDTTFQAAAQQLFTAAEADGMSAAVKQRFADRGITVG